VRYFVKAPDQATYERIVKRLRNAGVVIHVEMERRRALSADDLSDALIQELEEEHAAVSPEIRQRFDDPGSAGA
jgi:hypothetical protein